MYTVIYKSFEMRLCLMTLSGNPAIPSFSVCFLLGPGK